MRSRGVGRRPASAGLCPAGTGSRCVAANLAAAARLSAAGAIGYTPRSAVIASSAFARKAMAAPAVAIAPAAPGAHAQENAVVEVPWPVVTIGRAGIRRIAVVAIRTAWLNADVNQNLRWSRWRQGQAGEQCRCTE